MKRAGLLWIPLAAAVVLTGACSNSGDTKRGAPPEKVGEHTAAVGTGGAGANLKNDSDFVQDVASKNAAVLKLSQMALDKSTRPDVRAFAQKLLDDHSGIQEKLRSVSQPSTASSAQLDDKASKSAEDLAKEQGADFDRDYVKAMIDGHQNLSAKLESRLDVQSVADWKTAAAGRTQNEALPDPNGAMGDVPLRPFKSAGEGTMKINQWAADTYPIEQKHLDTVRMLENATKK